MIETAQKKGTSAFSCGEYGRGEQSKSIAGGACSFGGYSWR